MVVDPVLDIVDETLSLKKQALIFCSSKKSAQKTAVDIAKKLPSTNPELGQLILQAVGQPTDQCKILANCVSKGVAFHHAGISAKQRSIIEDAFRSNTLFIIASTPTLAAGVDLPAFRTILKEVKRFSPPWGMRYIPNLEYLQMAGRAGRPGKEEFGQAILIAKTEKEIEKLEEIYIHGEVESIYSKLAAEPILRTYVLSLLATGICSSEKQLIDFFAKTFWAHQYKDMQELQFILQRVIRLLLDFSFIEKKISDFQTAADLLDDQSIRVTRLGERVSQLYIDPLTANHLIKAIQKQKLTEFGLIQLISCTLEMRPHVTIKAKEKEKFNEILFEHENELLMDIPTYYDIEYEDFAQSIKTTVCLQEWINEKGENDLFTLYDIRPGEINAKVETADWLLYCCAELAKCLAIKPTPFIKLRIRVKNGVKEELLPLLQLQNVGRVRARKLFSNNIQTIQDVKNVQITTLQRILGDKIAYNLKKQVGVEITDIQKTL